MKKISQCGFCSSSTFKFERENTYKAHTLYAISPNWPAKNRLLVRNLNLTGNKVILLETGQVLKTISSGKNTIVNFPAFDPAKIHTPYSYVVKIEGMN